MEAVLIGSAPYSSYNSLGDLALYLDAAHHAGEDWSGASDLVRAQAAVTATRILDRQRWRGSYDTQDERFAVQAIRDAHAEMVLALLQGSDFQSEQNASQKLQSIQAGSVSLSYFRGADGTPHRFPLIVHELLRDYLAGADLAVGMRATGTDGVSSTEDDYGHTEGI